MDHPPNTLSSSLLHAEVRKLNAWERILQHLLLGQGFQLLFAVGDSPRVMAAFRETLAMGVLERLGKPFTFEVINPYADETRAPLTVDDLVEEVLTRLVYLPSGAKPDCLAIDGSYFHRVEDTWAWIWLFWRMNERRNVIAKRVDHNLMLCFNVELFKVFAAQAPDFWSVQSAFVSLPGLADLQLGVEQQELEP